MSQENITVTLSLHPYLYELIVKESLRRRKNWASLVQDLLYQHVLGKIEMVCEVQPLLITKIVRTSKKLNKPISLSRDAYQVLCEQAEESGTPYRTYIVIILAQWVGWYRDSATQEVK